MENAGYVYYSCCANLNTICPLQILDNNYTNIIGQTLISLIVLYLIVIQKASVFFVKPIDKLNNGA
jgi:hypothetical protein